MPARRSILSRSYSRRTSFQKLRVALPGSSQQGPPLAPARIIRPSAALLMNYPNSSVTITNPAGAQPGGGSDDSLTGVLNNPSTAPSSTSQSGSDIFGSDGIGASIGISPTAHYNSFVGYGGSNMRSSRLSATTTARSISSRDRGLWWDRLLPPGRKPRCRRRATSHRRRS